MIQVLEPVGGDHRRRHAADHPAHVRLALIAAQLTERRIDIDRRGARLYLRGCGGAAGRVHELRAPAAHDRRLWPVTWPSIVDAAHEAADPIAMCRPDRGFGRHPLWHAPAARRRPPATLAEPIYRSAELERIAPLRDGVDARPYRARRRRADIAAAGDHRRRRRPEVADLGSRRCRGDPAAIERVSANLNPERRRSWRAGT